MSSILVQFVLLLIFSFSLAAVVSCYRDDEPSAVLQGIPRRMLLFAGTVSAMAAVSYLLGVTLLAPGA